MASRRYVGQSDLIPSNATPGGMIGGSQVGGMLPTLLESLQEAPSAAQSTALYYEEKLGYFNQPSFQKSFGVRNETVDNVDAWGGTGTFSIDNDIFWNGPAMIKMKVQLRPRWMGVIYDNDSARSCVQNNSFFYSWGAGYAALKQLRMNMGGAGQYTLDRYANFIGVFASCCMTVQRAALMKLSGGGVICETHGFETTLGISGSTATYGTIPTAWYGGAAVGDFSEETQLITPNQRVPVEDNWMIAIKTPHTNYNNPRIRRRPIDTKILSEHFTVDFWLSAFDEVCDSGTGFMPMKVDALSENEVAAFEGALVRSETSLNMGGFFPEHFRQYDRGAYGSIPTAYAGVCDPPGLVRYRGFSVQSYIRKSQLGSNDASSIERVWPENETLSALQGELLSAQTLPPISIETIVSSLRLTNDMLGAYDVLKTRTDQAVYYPFQHFTVQHYFVQNSQYGGLTLLDYITQTNSVAFPSKDSLATKSTVPVSIPVNPMTAMYIAVFREKDRRSNGISRRGSYSPVLFWNALELTCLEVTYGAEPLIRYNSHAEYLSEQMYEHLSPIQIPYKGGFVARSEMIAQCVQGLTGAGGYATVGLSNISGGANGLYHGAIRNAYLYEISLVEMEPLRNEAFLQQTPSFQGEQLNVSFTIPPTSLAEGSGVSQYTPASDLSYISDYWVNGIEAAALCNLSSDTCVTVSGTQQDGITQNRKGGRYNGGTNLTEVWSLNDDANLMVTVVYAQNALWQMNPNMSKLVFARG